MPSVPVASRVLYAAAWGVGRLPRSLQRGLGTALGELAWRANGREPRVARRNLELALPGMAPGEREALVRAVMRETGRASLETLRGWKSRQLDLCHTLGWQTRPSDANYFVARPERSSSSDLGADLAHLRARGILPVPTPRQEGPRAFPSQYVPDPPGDSGRR